MELTSAFEFSAELEWLNCEPQNLADLRGQIVVLLFWNASSVYCHNALYELEQLQRKYTDNLFSIGVHIPKFTAELDTRVVDAVLNRLNIQLPIVCDKKCDVWQKYAVESWPTFIIIDDSGIIIEQILGDQQLKNIDAKVSELIASKKQLSKFRPKEIIFKKNLKSLSVLNSPSALLIQNKLLYVSDTGNNRIIECTLEGHVKRIFGNGLALNTDGVCTEASFKRPTGLCLSREYLYVADTGNHAIRRIRLLDGVVDTLLGNGYPGRATEQVVSSFYNVQLNNPISISVQHDILYIADSGNNCLWMYNLVTRNFSLLVGNGELGLLDGVAARAEMAHPLCISGDKNNLFVIEGSSSSLRSVALPEGRVNTLIGQGLFNYGASEGSHQTALMQHPCSIVLDKTRDVVWIADSYNRKIRSFSLTNNNLTDSQINADFLYPSAIATDDESIWIADSGANLIYRYYFATQFLSRITIQPS